MRYICGLAVLCLMVGGCYRAVYEPLLYTPAESSLEDVSTLPLKVHLRSGELLYLSTWTKTDSSLNGLGIRYDLNRNPVEPARHRIIPLDSIVFLETQVQTAKRFTAAPGLAIWSIFMGIATIQCVVDPKSCFGSCPTFYVPTDSGEVLVAEGFSASIVKALEARDVDALYPVAGRGGAFTLAMRNEALETHAVRRVRLLAAPRPRTGRILSDAGGRLYSAVCLLPPRSAVASDGDCLADLIALDARERTSQPDSTDLAAKEHIELTFKPVSGQVGLVLSARQSLMTTFLFYETLGFLGSRAGEVLATMERGGPEMAQQAMGMARLIGTIDLEVWNGQGWQPLAVHDEAGPLATQIVVYPFAHGGEEPVRVRLTMARGAWRLNWVALAELNEPVEPVVLDPVAVHSNGTPDTVALKLLRDPQGYLVTYPGETYDILFNLPQIDGQWELFLESQGYYYEWMRGEWLADEDEEKARMALYEPARLLKWLAPAYVAALPEMEKQFWNSRFRR